MPSTFGLTFSGGNRSHTIFLAGFMQLYPGVTMSKRIYTQEEIEAALASAKHVAGGIIGVWRTAEGPRAVRIAEQVKDAYEADFRRLLRGVPT